MNEKHFWSRISISSPEDCWPWTGYCMREPKNYGQLGIGKKVFYAHRIAYELTHNLEPGSLPGDSCVLHRCDNPPCCNPGHLFLGSKADNNRDMIRKGRYKGFGGEARKGLTWAEVDKLRSIYETGLVTQRELASLFKISQGQISAIVNGKQWKR